MGVESGSVGLGLGSVSAGPSVGPSIGKVGSFINEGPVAPKFLENTMPLTLNSFKPLGEIIFNPEPKPAVLAQAEKVAAKAWELPLASQGETLEAVRPSLVVNSIVKDPEQPAVVRLPNPTRGLDIKVIANPFGAAKAEAAPQSIVSPSTEGMAVSRVARITSTPAQSYIQTEQVVQEKKILAEREADNLQTKRNEETTQLKVKLVEAVEVSKNRVRSLREAYQKVKAEGLRLKWLRKFLGKEYWQHLSPIAKSYDGTLDLTVKDVEVHADEIKGDQEAENAFAQAVSNHIPVEEGKGGRLATVEEVREVREGIEKENLKSNTPAEIVVSRLVKKIEAVKGNTIATTVSEEKTDEPSLKDFPDLAEVFKSTLTEQISLS